MYSNLSENIKIIQPQFAPFTDGINRGFKLSDNYTFGELYDASKHINKEYFLQNGIPLHKNFLTVFELIRKHTGKPLYNGSSYRSLEWEYMKDRSGHGDHPKANGYDLKGENLKQVLDEALTDKNQLYYDLRQLGVNAFGRYDWGYHLGFDRPQKPNNKIYYWDNSKKNNFNYWYALLPIVLLFSKPVLKFLKIV